MSDVSLQDAKRVERVARCFGTEGRLVPWPSKRAEQLLALWVVWSQLLDDMQMSEAEVSAMLRGWHDYEDFALLRRELVDLGMLRRTPNGRVYRKIACEVPDEGAALLDPNLGLPIPLCSDGIIPCHASTSMPLGTTSAS